MDKVMDIFRWDDIVVVAVYLAVEDRHGLRKITT